MLLVLIIVTMLLHRRISHDKRTNKAIVRRFYKAFEEEDMEALKEVLAPDLVAYNPNAQNREHTCRGSNWNAAFSDNHFEIHEQIAEGDLVVTRVTLRCLHTKAPFAGILPTGTPFRPRGDH